MVNLAFILRCFLSLLGSVCTATPPSHMSGLILDWAARDEIYKFLDPMPKELAMEKIRQQYFVRADPYPPLY